MTTTGVSPDQRHTRRNPCRICVGHAEMAQGQGRRCYGFLSADGEYEHCTREEHAGDLAMGDDGTYAHRLHGPCKCGKMHGDAPITPQERPIKPAKRDTRRVTGETSWDILDGDAKLVGRHVRRDFVDAEGVKSKTFSWVEHTCGAVEMPLYNLPAHLAAPQTALRIICEGEKCADATNAALKAAGRAHEALALATVTGAGGCPCDASLSVLQGYRVATWADGDTVGVEHMRKVAQALIRIGMPTPQHVECSTTHDAGDYFRDGGTVDGMLAMVKERPVKQSAEQSKQSPTDPVPAQEPWQPTVQSAADLMKKVLPPVRWAVEGLFPEGVNLLAAKAKKGKSTMMLHVACAIADGVKAMGYFVTTKSEVLYLALEDNERRMQKRLRNMLQGESAPAGLHFAYEWLPLDMGGDKALDAYLNAHPDIHVVVIDTLEHVRPKRRSATGSYADDYAAVRWLQQMAGRRQLCVAAISHLRKAPAEDPFDEINATMGLIASVDNALVMRSANGVTELHRRGRDFEDDTVLALKGDVGTLLWRVEGKADDVTRSAERTKLLLAIRETGADGISPAALVVRTGMPRQNVDFLLFKLVNETNAPAHKVARGLYVATEFLSAYQQAQGAAAKKPTSSKPLEFSTHMSNPSNLSDHSDLSGGDDAGEEQRTARRVLPFPAMPAMNAKIAADGDAEAGIQAVPDTNENLSAGLSDGDAPAMKPSSNGHQPHCPDCGGETYVNPLKQLVCRRESKVVPVPMREMREGQAPA